GRAAEGTVEAARELRAVAHDRHAAMARRVERRSDVPDTAVHHVAWRDTVGAGRRRIDGGTAQRVERRAEIDLPAVVEQRAVPVRGCRAQADVDPEVQRVAEPRLDGRDGP